MNLNFKFSVIEALMHEDKLPQFDARAHLASKGIEMDFVESLQEPYQPLITYYSDLELPREALGEVRELIFDAGLDVLVTVFPAWDGEDDRFEIKSVEGIDLLTKLEKIWLISNYDDAIIDELTAKGWKLDEQSNLVRSIAL